MIIKALLTRLKSLAGRKMIPIANPLLTIETALKQVKILLLKSTRVETQARADTLVARISPTMTTSPKALKTKRKQRREMLTTS